MHKKIVSTCSANNNVYWVCIQYIVTKFPDGLLLVTPYVGRDDYVAFKSHLLRRRDDLWEVTSILAFHTYRI